jgi:antitoxin (DNA-binding transcriptional repressor) of toxin-antitoxin stability system
MITKLKETVTTQLIDNVQTIGAGEFKAKCLALIDEVFETGKTVIITKRGEARVMMVPIGTELNAVSSAKSLFGCLRGMIETDMSDEELMSPAFHGKNWDQMFDEKWDRVEKENAEARKSEK